MTIIYSDDSGPIIWPESDSHDPDSKKYYEIVYRPPTHLLSTEYIKGLDVVVPSTPNGCMYECISGGISSSIEPTWLTVERGATEDGDVKWRCKPAILRLGSNDIVEESAWSGPSWVTLSGGVILDNKITAIQVTGMTVPLKTVTFTLVNHVKIRRDSGRLEEFDKSLIIPIASL